MTSDTKARWPGLGDWDAAAWSSARPRRGERTVHAGSGVERPGGWAVAAVGCERRRVL